VRLLCPKCDAEYEIPNDVIPAEGRNVQCSGCQETWFVPANTPPRARTTIDPKVSSILQQEVQREMAARKAETRGAHETAPGQASTTNGLPPDVPPPTAAPSIPRPQTKAATASESLPPIDTVEISSLVSPTDHAPALTKPVLPSKAPDDVAPLDNRQRGKVAAFLILSVLTVIYISAPQITENFPSQTDRINAYVFWVDDLRQWLQHGLQAILDYRMSFSL
jgi:predicted Zn finger-like uncharacterized protein